MKLVITETNKSLDIIEKVTKLYIYPFNAAIDKVPVAAFLAKGDVLLGTGAGTYSRLAVGANGQILVARDTETTGLKYEDQTSTVITSQFWLGVGSGILPTTAPCDFPQNDTESSTYKQNTRVAAFDPDTEEHMEFEHPLPSDYDEGTVTATFYWKHKATDTNFDVVWGIEAMSLADDADEDQDYGSPVTVTDTGGTTDHNYKSPATSALTIALTPEPGDMVKWRIFRKAADDNLAVDALLKGVMITYGRAG